MFVRRAAIPELLQMRVKFVAMLLAATARRKTGSGTYFHWPHNVLTQAKCQRGDASIEEVLLVPNYSGAGSSSREV